MTKLQITSGAVLDLLDPNPDLIDAAEIASILAVTPRFGGRARMADGSPWTVAMHSMLVQDIVCRAVPNDYAAQLWALLHDAHETYIGDITTPVSKALGVYPYGAAVGSLKGRLDHAICQAFGMPPAVKVFADPIVARADKIALASERAAFLAPCKDPAAWGDLPAPIPIGYSPAPATLQTLLFGIRLETSLRAYHGSKRDAA